MGEHPLAMLSPQRFGGVIHLIGADPGMSGDVRRMGCVVRHNPSVCELFETRLPRALMREIRQERQRVGVRENTRGVRQRKMSAGQCSNGRCGGARRHHEAVKFDAACRGDRCGQAAVSECQFLHTAWAGKPDATGPCGLDQAESHGLGIEVTIVGRKQRGVDRTRRKVGRPAYNLVRTLHPSGR